jgi:hypothetical protein
VYLFYCIDYCGYKLGGVAYQDSYSFLLSTKDYGRSLDYGFCYDSMNAIVIVCERQHVHGHWVC